MKPIEPIDRVHPIGPIGPIGICIETEGTNRINRQGASHRSDWYRLARLVFVLQSKPIETIVFIQLVRLVPIGPIGIFIANEWNQSN